MYCKKCGREIVDCEECQGMGLVDQSPCEVCEGAKRGCPIHHHDWTSKDL